MDSTFSGKRSLDAMRSSRQREFTANASQNRAEHSTFRTASSRVRSSTQSRRQSSRTATGRRTQTTRAEDTFVVALIENNANEVGLCAYNLRGFDVELRQFSDSNTLSNTITALCLFEPVEILLSLSSANGLLEDTLQNCSYLCDIKRSFIARAYFNETQGALAVERLSTERCSHLTNLSACPYYLALACCGALLRYIEHTNSIILTPGTLRIRFKPNEGSLFLDIQTIEFLELMQNGRACAQAQRQRKRGSMLLAMDKTKTRAGKRLLRRSLLEPSSELGTITMRQDAVEELSNKEQTYFKLAGILSKFPDLEHAITGMLAREAAAVRRKTQSMPPKSAGTASSRSSSHSMNSSRPGSFTPDFSAIDEIRIPSITLIRNVIYVKAALDSVSSLLKSLEGSESSLLIAIGKSMRMPALATLRDAILETIDSDAAPSRDIEHMRLQGAFAVKASRNEQLDVARKTLSENVEDMHSLVESLKAKYNYDKLSLSMAAKRGYHFTLPATTVQASKLPDEFIQVQEGGRLHRFSSVALNELNDRYHESLTEIWSFTDVELGSLLIAIFDKKTVAALHRFCDSVALLDLLVSFVTYSSLSQVPHIRPRMTMDGPIALRRAHNPILLQLRATTSVPNDVFIDETSALHIITGSNQAGKSTFLKTVGLVSVMAHTGCGVPAEFASLRILHKIHSRFNTSDDLSHMQSHFSREMHEAAGILSSIKENEEKAREHLRSREHTNVSWSNQISFRKNFKHILVLMDELGRSTSTVDGFSIAYAIIERLTGTPGVLTFFTTHFLGLAALDKVHPAVRVFHLVTKEIPQNPNTARNNIRNNQSENGSVSSQRNTDCKGPPRAEFTYVVKNGALDTSNYGVDTAHAAGFPMDVIRDAMDIRKEVPVRRIGSAQCFADTHYSRKAVAESRQTKAALAIVERVSMLRSSASDSDSLQHQLQEFQAKMRRAADRSRGALQKRTPPTENTNGGNQSEEHRADMQNSRNKTPTGITNDPQ